MHDDIIQDPQFEVPGVQVHTSTETKRTAIYMSLNQTMHIVSLSFYAP